MPHPAKTAEPATRKVLHRSVKEGGNKSMTKKEGAGGKGTWGKAGAQDPIATDKNDPNYDSEGEDYVMEVTE